MVGRWCVWSGLATLFFYHYTYVLNSGLQGGRKVEGFGKTGHLQFIFVSSDLFMPMLILSLFLPYFSFLVYLFRIV